MSEDGSPPGAVGPPSWAPKPWRRRLGGWTALGLYSALSIVLTWPLVLGIGRDVPGDLGDSLLNMWILAWGAEHLPGLLTFQISWSEYWNANIFAPEPRALALSEHLTGQVLQILPVYWLTGNIILCYNLLFLSTFALSAFGTYLLVRDLTGSPRAAFIAGLIYGFLPYRIPSVPHLQVMSSQWMPFALWGLNRFISSGSLKWLGAGAGALVMQAWSCTYYLLYFSLFVPLFVVHRMWTLGTVRTVRTWMWLVTAAIGTVLLTVPFLLPYQEAARSFQIERPFGEVMFFSANVWSYLTASENLRLWGSVLRFSPRPEGETFLGFMPWLLAAVAVVPLVLSAPSSREDSPRLRWVKIVLLILVLMQGVAMFSVVVFGGFDADLFGLQIRARTPMRAIFQFVAVTGVLLVVSPRMRDKLAYLVRSPEVFFSIALVLALWLSLGPMPSMGDGRASGFGIYRALYDYVPGFNGVRVPARYAMIAGLFLAVLAGYGARLFTFRFSFFVALAALVVVEGFAVPMEINRVWGMQQAMPPSRVYPRAGAPPVYARVAALPAGTILTEFPFGDGAWEIRYVYYAAAHWKPITNGYSGAFPPSYKERLARLQRVGADPDAAWQSLRASGTTHVVVHRNAFAKSEDADLVESWLKARGAKELERFADGDILFALGF